MAKKGTKKNRRKKVVRKKVAKRKTKKKSVRKKASRKKRVKRKTKSNPVRKKVVKKLPSVNRFIGERVELPPVGKAAQIKVLTNSGAIRTIKGKSLPSWMYGKGPVMFDKSWSTSRKFEELGEITSDLGKVLSITYERRTLKRRGAKYTHAFDTLPRLYRLSGGSLLMSPVRVVQGRGFVS